MTASKRTNPTADVILTPFRSWTPCFCGLMLIGAALFYFAFPTVTPAIVFIVLCTVMYLVALGLLSHAMWPVIGRRALALRLKGSIKGAKLRMCVTRQKLDDSACLEGARSTIVLEVPRTSEHKKILQEIALYLRLNKFNQVEERDFGGPAMGTRMVFRNRMINYGILCSMRSFRTRPNSLLCVVHVMRLVG